jgi:hypothetical protein
MNYYNHKTKITTSTLGILLGFGGLINHGIFEILQGNTPTEGFFIEAIGISQRFWLYGTEGAVTIIQNFLATGIIVIIISLGIIIWSVKYIQLKKGATVFLILIILLTSFGGGIGHILLSIPTWAFATRINKPLKWWDKKLSEYIKKSLSKWWLFFLILATISWLIVMELGIFGYFPGQSNPDIILNLVFTFLFSSVIFANAAYICAFAKDIEERKLI